MAAGDNENNGEKKLLWQRRLALKHRQRQEAEKLPRSGTKVELG